MKVYLCCVHVLTMGWDPCPGVCFGQRDQALVQIVGHGIRVQKHRCTMSVKFRAWTLHLL